jgi:hypothetical protein
MKAVIVADTRVQGGNVLGQSAKKSLAPRALCEIQVHCGYFLSREKLSCTTNGIFFLRWQR